MAEPKPLFRKVERLVAGRFSPIEFEHLRTGDVFRFVDTPEQWHKVLGDPQPVAGQEGNHMLECDQFTTSPTYLVEPPRPGDDNT